MATQEFVGSYKFGRNIVQAETTGEFTIEFVNGGEWKFDIGEINRLDSILSNFEKYKMFIRNILFWRTNGSKIIQVYSKNSIFDNIIYLNEGGIKEAYFWHSELEELRKKISLLTSQGAPYGTSIKLIEVIEQSRHEELVTSQKIPLNNINSNSPLIIERNLAVRRGKNYNLILPGNWIRLLHYFRT